MAENKTIGEGMKLPITAIILTKNEALHIERCLKELVPYVERVVVVDSFSDDGTQDIAKKNGAEVTERAFKYQADQFNWALDNVKIDTEWVIRLDADEYVLPGFWEELAEKMKNAPAGTNGFMMKRRVIFMDRWMRHGGYYPAWFTRIFRKGTGRYEDREMDEHLIVNGAVGKLSRDFADHNLKPLEEWVARHNNYSTREAKDYFRSLQTTHYSLPTNLTGQAGKKRALKMGFYYRLPLFFRAGGYFCYRYFFRLGFLDGRPGLIFHFLQGFWYRFLIDAKIYESRIKKIY